jgi:hypothetical protein
MQLLLTAANFRAVRVAGFVLAKQQYDVVERAQICA